MTIYFAERVGVTAAALAAQRKVTDTHAPAPGPNEQTAIVNVKGLTYQEIWNRLQTSTGATEVEATPEDVEEQNRLQQLSEKAVVDRGRVAAVQQAKKDQERMLAEARGEIEEAKKQV